MPTLTEITGQIDAINTQINTIVPRLDGWVTEVGSLDERLNTAITEAIGESFDTMIRDSLARYGFNLPDLQAADPEGDGTFVDGEGQEVYPTSLYGAEPSDEPDPFDPTPQEGADNKATNPKPVFVEESEKIEQQLQMVKVELARLDQTSKLVLAEANEAKQEIETAKQKALVEIRQEKESSYGADNPLFMDEKRSGSKYD